MTLPASKVKGRLPTVQRLLERAAGVAVAELLLEVVVALACAFAAQALPQKSCALTLSLNFGRLLHT